MLTRKLALGHLRVVSGGRASLECFALVLVGDTLCSCDLTLGYRSSYYLGLLCVPLRSLDSSLEGFTPLLHVVNSCLAGLSGGEGGG